MRSLLHRATTFAALLSSAAACKKAPPPAEPAPPAAPAAVAVASLELGKAVGPDNRVTGSTTTFGLRDTVYASVATTGVSSGTSLTARWTFETGQTVDSTSRSIAPNGPATTEFHIAKRTPWPAGKYKVTILLDGAPALDKDFEIKR